MEFWLTVSKLIVFIYIVFSYIHSNVTNLPWSYICFAFISFCKRANLYIKKIRTKILICISISVVMLLTWRVHPFLFCFTFEFIRNYIPLHRQELVTLCYYDAPITIDEHSNDLWINCCIFFLVLTMADRYISRSKA